MKYQKTIDIWTLTEEQVAALPPGQWVSAGKPDADRSNVGVFCGVRKSGSIVVAWRGNQRKHKGEQAAYRRHLMTYAKG